MASVGGNDDRSHKLSGITALKPPGEDSNYLDWEFALELYFVDAKLTYFLKETEPKSRPSTWADDNARVCTLISRAVDDANYQYLKPHRHDAAAMWKALRLAHEDSTSGGRMLILNSLITSKMGETDLDTHLNSMNRLFEKLASLITAEHPLTANDIFTMSLINSLPNDWAHVVTPLMQQKNTDSASVIRAIKNEQNRRHSSGHVSVSKASKAHSSTSKSSNFNTSSYHRQNDRRPKNNKLCLFCKRTNHTVDHCWALDEIIAKRKDSAVTSNPSASTRSRNPISRAGKTSVVALDFSDSDDHADDDDSPVQVRFASADTANASRLREWNIDSGCSTTMTPYPSSLTHLSPSTRSIHLADNSMIHATHSGNAELGISGVTSHTSLLVPDLQEPLLSVSSLCDDGLTVVFTKKNCKIFHAGDDISKSDPVRIGARRGNLYYLPEKDISESGP